MTAPLGEQEEDRQKPRPIAEHAERSPARRTSEGHSTAVVHSDAAQTAEKVFLFFEVDEVEE